VIQSKNSAMCSWFILFGIIQAAIEIGMFHHFNYLLSVLGEKELLNPTNGRSARNQPQRKRSWDRHEARIEKGMKIKEQQHMIAADLYC
jgi:predicted transcriptional regulator